MRMHLLTSKSLFLKDLEGITTKSFVFKDHSKGVSYEIPNHTFENSSN
jgi:hypothetical protein